jgi:AbrB family looped-hinge helix DNA binding protein
VTQMYRVRIGKQGRIVLPKEIREEYDMKAGDEVTMIVKGDEITLRIKETPEDPLEDLRRLAERISIGLSTHELKRLSDEERLREFIRGRAQSA